MKIPDVVREDAAMICSLSASAISDVMPVYREATEAIGASHHAYLLALAAWNHVLNRTKADWTQSTDADAESESLLRTGWSPS